MSKSFKKNLPLHLMILPSVILLFIYHYIPIFGGLTISFQNYMPALGFFKSTFVGLDNFKMLFTMPGFSQALFNTVFIALMKIIAGMIVPITLALMLNEVRFTFLKRSMQTILYLPFFISWVLMAGIIIDILSPTNGIVNRLISIFGIHPIFFLADNKWFPTILIASNIWKEAGYGTIIYMASLSGISPTLYEAAVMDGAGHWKRMLHVTLPGLVPTIILLGTLSLGNILNAGFDQVYNLMSPVTVQSGDIIDTFVYRIGFSGGQFSVATAAGLFKSVISFAFIAGSYKLAHKFADYRIF